MKTILSAKRDHYLVRLGIFLIAAALIAGIMGCGPPGPEIRTWYDLNAIRKNLGGSYILMNDLDSTTPGYEDLAGPRANGGQGWLPLLACRFLTGMPCWGFSGTFDGQGYEIHDLFINRPSDQYGVGLFGWVDAGAVIKNIGMVNVTVAGPGTAGGLVGQNGGTVGNSYSTGTVTGGYSVGGLVGQNGGTVSNSYCTGSVTGSGGVGGLVGQNYEGTVSNSYSTGNVTGSGIVGGLVGQNYESTVSNSYSTGSVGSMGLVGGLVGQNAGGTVSNSYSTGTVTGGELAGGLVGQNIDGGDGTVASSFWDIQTSGQPFLVDGTGKTTVEMRDSDTFSGAGWNITAVANPATRNASYIWNIVDGQTYPFLSWQAIS